ncbi:T9SS type A sorting domain-containing protein [Flavobacterium sp. DGU11]|uniref:T9SS type A sorting domain-containing protein n=1 Tax=Flavobacterium arundinis TaxID=3139143 RepID=A0ABU9HYQ2_9FLAO
MKKSLLSNFFKGAAVFGFTLFSLNSINAQVNVTVGNLGADPAVWIGYASFFENNGNFENGQELIYAGGSPWGVAEIKSELDAANNQIKLYPNYNAYNATDSFWSDGNGNGNKIFEGSTFTERTDLAGQQLVFSGKTLSSTLLPEFKDTAFIKILDPANNYATEFVVTAALTAGENFTLSTGNFVIQPGRIVQYGFSVLGKNANPTQMTANGFTVVTADEPAMPESNNVTISASTTPLNGYANFFQLDGTTYAGGSPWAVADLKTVLNQGDGTIDLHPNFNAWNEGDTFWVQNGAGQKIFEGNTYVEDNTLINQDVTFSGHCISNSLAAGYTGIAFIKVLSGAPNYALVLNMHVPLVAGENFSIHVAPGDYANGAIFQYGYSVTGVNANPTQETALGYARVGAATAGVTDVEKNTFTMYPNPASNVLNFASENAIEGIQVYNVMGQKVIDTKPAQNNASVDVSGLTSGVYIVNTTINGKQSSARFIKQ